MSSIITFAISEIQGRNIHSQEQANAYKKTVKVLAYTPWMDLALSIFLSIAGIATMFCPPLSLTLFAVSAICLLSGGPLLISYKSIKQLAEKRIEQFHTRSFCQALV